MSTQGSPNSIYLWTFGASTPNITLTQTSSNPNILSEPSGIALDPYSNLYVADKKNNRVVIYYVNSTIDITVVIGTGSTYAFNNPIPSVFDCSSNANHIRMHSTTQNWSKI